MKSWFADNNYGIIQLILLITMNRADNKFLKINYSKIKYHSPTLNSELSMANELFIIRSIN